MNVRNRSEEDNWRRLAFKRRLEAEQSRIEVDVLKDEMEAQAVVIDRLRSLLREAGDALDELVCHCSDAGPKSLRAQRYAADVLARLRAERG